MRYAVCALVLVIAAALGGCSQGILNQGILDPQGPIGATNVSIMIDSVAIMLAIVLPTIVAIFAFAYWFRHSNARARYLPDWEYSGRIELVV